MSILKKNILTFICFYLFVRILVGISCSADAHNVKRHVKLTSLEPVHVSQEWGVLAQNTSVAGKLLQIADRRFAFGLGTHADSEIIYALNHRYERFEVWVGVDADMRQYHQGSVVFKILVDGLKVFDSGLMNHYSSPQIANIDVTEVRELVLKVEGGGDGIGYDHADWGEPVLVTTKKIENKERDVQPKFTVTSEDMRLQLNQQGRICGLVIGEKRHSFKLDGGVRLAQCRETEPVQVAQTPSGAVECTRMLANPQGQRCRLVERFSPTSHNSVRWMVTIQGESNAWSTPVIIGWDWPARDTSRFWTAWSDPDMIGSGGWDPAVMKAEGWRDPLVSRPFSDTSRWYGGNPATMVPSTGDYFSIPLAVIMESDLDVGFSFVQSPEDDLLQMKMITRSDGTIEFQHLHHRISKDNAVSFSLDLVCHEDDWRSGLKWIVERYPDYFNPVNALAQEIAGCGAYSSWEGELDVEKLKKMAFRFNWKSSFDFPYMGMFLPPVDTWQTFATYEEATKDPWVTSTYQGQPTSIEQLNRYCQRMREYGFYVLNYFNVTEFGTNVKAESTDLNLPEDSLWRHCSAFLHRKIADGILYDDKGEFYRTWGNAIVMDCGGKDYQDFLIEQARRHIEKLPASSGICIDRLDWLRLFNPRADDSISWYDNQAARSLITSWKQLMERLGPLMHGHNKVIFANPMVSMRLDVLRHIDGIYSEHNEMGPALNASALLGLRMPVVAWTWNEDSLRPDPDLFFQRLLYLGVFPTAPVPYNNHTILPSEFVDKWYLDYGPLLNELSGRTWVLKPHVIRVLNPNARANIFKVPSGYSIPVVSDEKELSQVTLELNAPEWFSAKTPTAEVLHPGSENSVAVIPTYNDEWLVLKVPLVRGCGLLRLKY